MNYLDLIAFADRAVCPIGTADNFSVQFYSHAPSRKSKMLKQPCKMESLRDISVLTIYLNAHKDPADKLSPTGPLVSNCVETSAVGNRTANFDLFPLTYSADEHACPAGRESRELQRDVGNAVLVGSRMIDKRSKA